ncbi:uncharacterized protein Eint_100680 [Encephalitozoon intestinalis ATCC 50506]|uniref:Uncharacterized protein n=1 Tax=Encephalitozoon intestinalis (strain ATCC 50506) TaxID=876142 RepID=E0S9K9_ENCIT|nr:uncharacterized protein Eint_100680 [Encephalitozoon intestinalis ATCC 50506]ADM12394.1 hypothetical protein Eint_100680 [Encephalitozoon intestinalis ATCC 50506]UTX46226.1 hypothetical protein GPK93_10g18240 [Encephalitozoon intestinalis]
MIHDEKMLLKSLEHKNIEEKEIFPSICSVLGLQYFSEENGALAHTLASPSFIIDISGLSAKLTFVDESFSRYFKYVEFYLCQHLEKRNMRDFYFYLRMFVRMETGNEGLEEKDSGDICQCVFNGGYCINPSFRDVAKSSTDGIYDIYRHRFEYHMYTKRFIFPIPVNDPVEDEDSGFLVAEGVNGKQMNAKVSLNLSRYFGPKAFDREVLRILPHIGFYWKGMVDHEEVVVRKDLGVYVNGELRRDAAFLMKLGKNLHLSLNFLRD